MKGLLIITALGLFAMLAQIFRIRRILLPTVLVGIVVAYAANVMEWTEPWRISYFDQMIHFDRPALAFSGVISVSEFQRPTSFWIASITTR